MSEHRHMTRTLLAHFRSATPQAHQAGMIWYATARDHCERLAEIGYQLETVAVVVAHLSPRTNWANNLELAEMLLLGKERPQWALTRSWDKALSVLDHPAPLETFTLRALKTREFARAVLGDKGAVVVDTWAARAAGMPENTARTVAGYHKVADAYRRGARIVKIAPADLQAVVWCAVRGASE